MCFKIKLEAIKVIQRRRITEWPSFNYLYLSITNWDKTGQRVCSSSSSGKGTHPTPSLPICVFIKDLGM